MQNFQKYSKIMTIKLSMKAEKIVKTGFFNKMGTEKGVKQISEHVRIYGVSLASESVFSNES